MIRKRSWKTIPTQLNIYSNAEFINVGCLKSFPQGLFRIEGCIFETGVQENRKLLMVKYVCKSCVEDGISYRRILNSSLHSNNQ